MSALEIAVFPTSALQRNVAVLLGRVGVSLVLEHFEGADDLDARLAGVDDVVDEAAGGVTRGAGPTPDPFAEIRWCGQGRGRRSE